MRTATLCRTCRFLSGCDLLISEDLAFDPARVSTDETPRRCKRWEPVGYLQGVVRLKVLEDFGPGALAAVHTLPRPVITEQEGTVAVDFLKMAGDGVTHNERAAQLRYMTDDAGELLLDDAGEKIPRLTYDLRKYATDPNGPVKAKETVVLFWTPAQLVKEILEAEKEAGIIVSPQEKKKLTKGAPSAPKTQKKEEKVMPKMNIKSGGIGGKGIGGLRMPATSKKVEKPEADDDKPASDSNGFRAKKPKGNGESAASAPTLSAEDLAQALGPVIQESVDNAMAKALEPVLGALEALKDSTMAAVKENQDVVIGGITILHDVLAPTVTGDEDRELVKNGVDIFAYMEGGDEGNAES